MTTRLAIFAMISLVGQMACTVQPQENPTLRDESITLAGSTRFEKSRFAGEWVTIACLGTCPKAERYTVAPDAMFVRQANDELSSYSVTGPGALLKVDGEETLVVMWVDEGFRTAAIGDASGRWASIIDRGTPSTDRTKAAAEVLEFNGWDVSQLQDYAV